MFSIHSSSFSSFLVSKLKRVHEKVSFSGSLSEYRGPSFSAMARNEQSEAVAFNVERKFTNRAIAIRQGEEEAGEEEGEAGEFVSAVKKGRVGENRPSTPCRMAGAIPFQWEKEPGKPKLDPQTLHLPPLSPPPNRLFSVSSSFPSSFPSSSSSSGSSHGHHSWASSPKAITRKVMHIFNKTFLRKSSLNPTEISSPPALKRSMSTKLNLPTLIRPKSKSHNISASDRSLSQPGIKHDHSFSPPKAKPSHSFSQPLVKPYPPSSLPRPSTSSSSSNSSSTNLDLSLSSSSSSFRSGPIESTQEYAPKKSGFPNDGNTEDLHAHTQYSDSYTIKSPYTASDMRTYSNPSSPLITMRRGGRRVNHSGPVNPSHYEAPKGPSFSSKRVADEYAQDHHTTFAEVVAASALMFGPPDDYAACDNSSFGCLPSRSHAGRNPHSLWHVINV